MTEQGNTERTVVKTYVPEYQKDEWAEDADRLDMTQSEFVRSMVQAGRRKFEPAVEEGASRDETPGVDGVEDRVRGILRERGPASWDELVEALSEDIEDRLDAALGELQQANEIQYSGRDGGYTLLEGTDGNRR
ncbi:DUF5805 domain-containing protein [Haloarculaceae archaeon H-GB1-1]|nr:DUF5805 domain-containing protein [Haloarculaceae archaeon H-GB1-1]